MIPLLYLRSVNQPRSEFKIVGSPGGAGQHMSFAERRQPALIGTAGDQTATGDLWIDPTTGRVNRAELRVVSRSRAITVLATIHVGYKEDVKSHLMLPVAMEEHYSMLDPREATIETIDAQAEYFNPRQFKVTVDGSVK